MPNNEVWVAGFPSRYGGADTELDHLLDLFRGREFDVHLVPMFGADPAMRADVLRRGCAVHDYRPDIFKDRTVLSFCNGEFLKRLAEIMAAGRPKRTIWFNCMTHLFEPEKAAHQFGWIDVFGFASTYQKRLLTHQLEQIRPVHTFDYRPYFNVRRVEWRYRSWDDGCYKIGRISRDDGAKFAADTWRIFDRVLVPKNLKKKVYILGYGPNAAAKIGPAPHGLDWRTWAGNEISGTEFFRTIDTMIHKTGGSRESYCRVLIEAYAHGVVPIVEHDYAFPELVVHGETGFMTSDSDEISYHASRLAHDPREHRRMAEAGRDFLRTRLMPEEGCWAGWAKLLSA